MSEDVLSMCVCGGGHNDYYREEMKSKNRVKILNEAVCISIDANTLRKGMNHSIPHHSYV